MVHSSNVDLLRTDNAILVRVKQVEDLSEFGLLLLLYQLLRDCIFRCNAPLSAIVPRWSFTFLQVNVIQAFANVTSCHFLSPYRTPSCFRSEQRSSSF